MIQGNVLCLFCGNTHYHHRSSENSDCESCPRLGFCCPDGAINILKRAVSNLEDILLKKISHNNFEINDTIYQWTDDDCYSSVQMLVYFISMNTEVLKELNRSDIVSFYDHFLLVTNTQTYIHDFNHNWYRLLWNAQDDFLSDLDQENELEQQQDELFSEQQEEDQSTLSKLT